MGWEESTGGCVQRSNIEKTTGDEGRSWEMSWDSTAVIQAKTEMAWFRTVIVEGVRNEVIRKNKTKQKITSIEEDVEKLETSYLASRNAK